MIRGIAVDLHGKPVRDAHVTLLGLLADSPFKTVSRLSTRTGVEGEFSFVGIEPRRYALVSSAVLPSGEGVGSRLIVLTARADDDMTIQLTETINFPARARGPSQQLDRPINVSDPSRYNVLIQGVGASSESSLQALP